MVSKSTGLTPKIGATTATTWLAGRRGLRREARLAFADDVIVNDKGLDDLQAAVARLHSRYVALAAARAAPAGR